MKEIRDKNGLTEKEFLEQYRPGDYERPSVTVDMILFTIKSEPQTRGLDKKTLQVGLIKRNGQPYLHHWAICGGFVNMNEDLDTAARRELLEETGVKDVYMEQLYTFGAVHRDPRMRVIDVAYYAMIPEDTLKRSGYQAGDDASEVCFFDLSYDHQELILKSETEYIHYKHGILQEDSTTGLAFDHAEILTMALERMRNKLWYTSIGFHLLNERFTLGEVQETFECIMNTSYTKQNFRTKILDMDMIESTGQVQKEGQRYRPAEVYKLKEGIK